MSARKSNESTTHDLTTTSGLLAAFDAEVERLNTVNHWCDSGRRYPYELSGYADGEHGRYEYRIPAPANRQNIGNLAILDMSDDLLSDAGKAAKAEANAKHFQRVRDGIKHAAKSAVDGGYMTAAQVNESLANLGFPAGTSTETRTVAVSISVYGKVDGKTRSIKGTPDTAAMAAAIKALFPDGAVTWTNDDYAHTDLGGTSRVFTVADPA